MLIMLNVREGIKLFENVALLNICEMSVWKSTKKICCYFPSALKIQMTQTGLCRLKF